MEGNDIVGDVEEDGIIEEETEIEADEAVDADEEAELANDEEPDEDDELAEGPTGFNDGPSEDAADGITVLEIELDDASVAGTLEEGVVGTVGAIAHAP